jgi:hypothetical protein
MISKNGIMKKYLFLLIAVVTLVGCSPQVTSEMVTSGYDPVATNKVMIVESIDKVEKAQAIGQVTVDGKAESVKSEYGKMLGMAVRETAQKGGNVLVMDYSEMDKNRLNGTMAYTDGEVNDSLTLSVRRIDELKAHLWGKPATVNTAATKTDKTETDVPEAATAEAESTGWQQEEEEPQGIMFKIGAGPMWTTSKLYLTTDAENYVTDQRGYGLNLSIAYTGKNIYGFGADFYGVRTEIDIPNNIRYYGNKPDYLMMYLGPSALIGGNITPWLRLDASLGLGLAYYHDDGQNEIGFGSRMTVGMEIMVTKTLGIGIDGVRQRCVFSKPDGFKQPDNESYGFDHLGAMLTVRFHY